MAFYKLSWFLCVISLPFILSSFNETDNPEVQKLLLDLLDYTGLSNLTPNHTIQGIECSDLEVPLTQCTINSNGTIVWDVRYEMYSQNMYYYANNSITLDGCQTLLPGNASQTAYDECMKTVRENMSSFLKTFDDRFKEILQSNCSGLAPDNCVELLK